MKRLSKQLLGALFLTLLTSGAYLGPSARAEEPAMNRESNVDRPWAKGVSKAKQDKAIQLFTEGTERLKEAFFVRAVENYQEALTYWDHPAIHFNLAKTLWNLDQLVDAYQHFEASLKFGGQPLTVDQVEQVKSFMKELYDHSLAGLHVVCDEPDAVVTLNGKELFTAPGEWKGVVRPGEATLSVTKFGFIPETLRPEVVIGDELSVRLSLNEIDTSSRYEWTFSPAIPWTLTSIGVALLAGGGVAQWQAGVGYRDYDNAITECYNQHAAGRAYETDAVRRDNGSFLAPRFKCPSTGSMRSTKSDAELMETLSMVGYVAGGALAATGIVLFIVNEKTEITTYTESADPITSITPYFSPDGAGISATFDF